MTVREPGRPPWHVTGDLAARYATGDLPEPDAWSLEKHVESCADCAGAVSAAVRSGVAGPVLDGVREAVLGVAAGNASAPAGGGWAGRPAGAPTGRAPRLRARAGRLLWAVGPALRGAWVGALLVVCAGALGLAHGVGFGGARPVLFALAPVLPLAGVGLSYGAHADPMAEITSSTPGGGLRLLLARTAAVLAVSLPLLLAVGAALPSAAAAPGAAALLLPSLALTLAALALGSYVGCRAATAGTATLWLLAVPGPALAASGDGRAPGVFPSGPLAEQLSRCLSGPAPQAGWALAAALGAALLGARRHAFDFHRRTETS
ncbi:zf-HC2 domain-containing protein [Streptomyces sp. NPDC059009]|uniref:zf-HC2 domain-containing protein n=1 Tax=Streptomyces sp. NPDC059009 TaxID=3346694 RepID=UPI0036AC1443